MATQMSDCTELKYPDVYVKLSMDGMFTKIGRKK